MSAVVTVGEPEPRKDGTVLFRVNVGGSEVHVTFSPLGIGVPADVPVSQANRASVAVTEHIADQSMDMVQHLRIAARLRREVHAQPPIDLSAGSDAQVRIPPTVKGNGDLLFQVNVNEVRLWVLLTRNGEIVDDCEDWSGVTSEMRVAALAGVLNVVLSDSERSKNW